LSRTPAASLISQVFAHRDAYEQVVSKTEEKLQRARLDYKRTYAALLTNDGGAEQELKRAYLESHNAYILQLRATNAITERYQFHCLPGLLGEIAEVYEELCGLACKCVAGISEAAGERAGEQVKRYQVVAKEAQAVVPSNDLQVIIEKRLLPRIFQKKEFFTHLFPFPPSSISFFSNLTNVHYDKLEKYYASITINETKYCFARDLLLLC